MTRLSEFLLSLFEPAKGRDFVSRGSRTSAPSMPVLRRISAAFKKAAGVDFL